MLLEEKARNNRNQS